MSLLLVPAAAPENPLLPAWPDIIWSIVALAVIALVFVYLVLPPFTKMLDERAEKIEGGLKAGEEARAEAATLRSGLEDELREARREAAHIRERANDDAKAIVAEARGKAVAEAERVADNARRQVEADRQAAEISLRTDVGLLASELASRIVGESLADSDVQSRVIDRFLDDLAAQRPARVEAD